MSSSRKRLFSVLLLACSALVCSSVRLLRFYPPPRRFQRLGEFPSTSFNSLHHSQRPINHFVQSDAPVSLHDKIPGYPLSQRKLNSNTPHSHLSSDHVTGMNYRTINYASHRDKKMAPSYFKNGNHHHITVPVPRNSVTRITLPLVNVHPVPAIRHHVPSSPSVTMWPSSTLSRSSQNHVMHVIQPHPYYPVVPPPVKKHNLVIHVGLGQNHVVPPEMSYTTHKSNHYRSSMGDQLPIIVNSNRVANSGKNDVYLQKWHSSPPNPYPPSTFVPSRQSNEPLEIRQHMPQSKSYEDWRNSLGTSTFQRKPSRNHSSRQHLSVRYPSRNKHHQAKKGNSKSLASSVTTSVNLPSKNLNGRKRTTVHIYLRPPQKHFVNSTVGTTPLPKFLQIPSNCIRCPSNQVVVIDKGKSCTTVTVPPIKLCSWLSKRPGKLEMELGVGPRPGKSIKEGNYMMQFFLFKGGAKVKTCQFRVNVKALRCPLVPSPTNGAVHCSNEALWGSTCNFTCNFGYTLIGDQAITCDGNKNAVSWTKAFPVCKENIAAFSQPGCKVPTSPVNGGLYCESEENNGVFSVGSVCHFICDRGFNIPTHLTQYGYIICLGNKWNITQNVECHSVQCQHPDEPEHGFASCIHAQPEEWTERGDTVSPKFLNGTECQYKCDKGYVIPSSQVNTTNIKCHAPFWDNTILPECLKQTPPSHHPDDCKNVTLTHMDAHTDVSFLMPRFFSASGMSLKPTCSLNGSLIIPGIYENNCEVTDTELRVSAYCSYNIIVRGCSPLPEIQNGIIKCTYEKSDLYPVSSECLYDCYDGYVIPKSMRYSQGRICLPSSDWNTTVIPECKRRLVPQPKEDACADVHIETRNLSSEISKPVFLTASGHEAEVTCTVLNVSHEGAYENTCHARDPELQTTASCKYNIIVKSIEDDHTTSSLKGHGCGALKAPANGEILCSSKGSKFICSIQCNEGYSLPSLFSKLHSNIVQCDQSDGIWNFQHFGETDLPDCLGQLSTTTLQRSLKFRVGVSSCSDYIALNRIMEAIESSLLSRIKDVCINADCSDLANNCGNDSTRNEQMIETTLTLKVTYNVSHHEGSEEVTDAEVIINKLQGFIEDIVTNVKEFKEEIDSVGGDLWQDSFTFERFTLACPEPGYVVDPDTFKCFQCPKGTFEEDGSCKPCPGNYYQDAPGRIYCVPCPRGTISEEGSESKSDCQVLERELKFPEPNREQALTESTVFTSCDAHPCKNGGTCNIMLNSFTCICKNGYTGKQCETVVCPENYCLNGGKCTSFANNVVGCTCPTSFSGERCENYTDPCSSNPCKNNGICALQDDTYRCLCQFDNMGEHCEYELCNKRFNYWYCQNGGVCHNVSGNPKCLCQENFTGLRCEYETGAFVSQEP